MVKESAKKMQIFRLKAQKSYTKVDEVNINSKRRMLIKTI